MINVTSAVCQYSGPKSGSIRRRFDILKCIGEIPKQKSRHFTPGIEKCIEMS